MTLEELAAFQQKMAEVEKQVIEDITAKAKLLGFELVRVDEQTHVRNTKRVTTAKFIHGENSWSGKGKRPTWLVQLLEAGHQLSEFAA